MRNTFDQSWHPARPIVVIRSSSSDRHGAIYRLEPREIAGNWRIQLLAPKLLVFWRSRATISLRRLAEQESIALNFSLNLIALHLNPTGCHEILAQAALIYVGYRETSRNRSLVICHSDFSRDIHQWFALFSPRRYGLLEQNENKICEGFLFMV